MVHTRKINNIYRSRNTVLELLDAQGYDTGAYRGFSVNEVDAMYKNTQLDMLLSHSTDGRKVYVKYYLPEKQKQLPKAALDDVVEDLYVLEQVLTKADTLMIVIDDEPNEATLTRLEYLFQKEGIFVVVHNMARLQYNILRHQLVPKLTILTDEETAAMMKEKHVSQLSQLPEISRFDPQALAMGVRPHQVCRFDRASPVAVETVYYRVCV
jgi:DNA-directed RNA polymerase subunit H (RpoH/RPB5)